MKFSWNYLKAGHGKGAPDGIIVQNAEFVYVC